MRYALLLALIMLCSARADAKHITGGEMIYEYLGPGTTVNSKSYRITLRLFRDEDCVNCAVMPNSVTIGIFDNLTRVQLNTYHNVPMSYSELLPLNPLPPCITNAPSLNYRAGYYTFAVDLPVNQMGYTATYQTCCRIDGIVNVPNSVGATYIAQIPGTNSLGGSGTDNSPQFARGISVVCYNKPFTLDFSAEDPDGGDVLIYSLCDAFDGGAANNASYNTPAAPPYNTIAYSGGYSGSFPLGLQATIDRNTGIISGIAPDAGRYVVSVCISVVRGARVITQHRKDFIIHVTPCDFAGAQLEPSYITCDGFSFDFENLNNSPLNNTFLWTFGDGGTSTQASPTHTYSAAGVYNVKLVVNQGAACSDSTTSVISVFPGYFPRFTNNSPMCKGLPVSFFDATTANYGAANSWLWSFGDETGNQSTVKNPVHTFASPGTYIVTLNVSSDKGCNGIFRDTILIVDKPVFTVTKDTLICSLDTLQLRAVSSSEGTVSWVPNYNINNVNSFTPLVSPDVTTTYTATFQDNFGCKASEQIRVNVVDSVTLSAMNDTTICRTDPVTLSLSSNALHYNWLPASSLNDPTSKNPVAIPTGTTVYTVKASIGKCESTEQISVKTVPYPLVNVSPDTSVCFGFNALLRATGGSRYTWTPTVFLSAFDIPDPIVIKPTTSITYIVTVRDTLGCPKPVMKTIRLSVVKIIADAGPSDTSVVLGQPLQLTATGSTSYTWDPIKWLSNSFIPNPVSFPTDNILYTVKVSDSAGCFATDTINVKLFKIKPDILVPSGFTPNGDGLNDVFRPIAIGMKYMAAFRVYNRWGQLLFSTTREGHGWNGQFGGNAQDAGTYVWFAEGVNYLDKKIHRKGYVVLIR